MAVMACEESGIRVFGGGFGSNDLGPGGITHLIQKIEVVNCTLISCNNPKSNVKRINLLEQVHLV